MPNLRPFEPLVASLTLVSDRSDLDPDDYYYAPLRISDRSAVANKILPEAVALEEFFFLDVTALAFDKDWHWFLKMPTAFTTFTADQSGDRGFVVSLLSYAKRAEDDEDSYSRSLEFFNLVDLTAPASAVGLSSVFGARPQPVSLRHLVKQNVDRVAINLNVLQRSPVILQSYSEIYLEFERRLP